MGDGEKDAGIQGQSGSDDLLEEGDACFHDDLPVLKGGEPLLVGCWGFSFVCIICNVPKQANKDSITGTCCHVVINESHDSRRFVLVGYLQGAKHVMICAVRQNYMREQMQHR